ncbi:calcium-binding protein, partial [uncultured Hoeflea sp.]|uniref:calcium-binding protein n=1 Tax=uncultured Hoeflea sp. TaxID=538666 RepID=UPI0030D90E9B
GRGGDDTLDGGQGNDTYVYARGDGNDTISEITGYRGTADQLVFTDINPGDVTIAHNGRDLVLTILESAPDAGDGGSVTILDTVSGGYEKGVEAIVFADGTTWDRSFYTDPVNQTGRAPINGTNGNDTLYGTSNDDTFVGGLGDDTVNSGAGSDTYVYASGDGNDYIDDESGSTTNVDILKLTDLNADDVTLSRSGVHARILVNSTGHIITLDEQFFSSSAHWGIEQIEFADGTVWDRTQIKDNSWIRGTAANDTLYGTSNDDTFAGGLGDDTVNSGAGSDTYVYASGDGNDYIDDESGSTTNVDILKLTDLNADDVTLSRSGVHARILVNSTGHIITLDEQFFSSSAHWGIEQIEFADGSVWDRAQIEEASEWINGTAGDDYLNGTAGNETIRGLAGDDHLDGLDGDDILLGGDGNDTLNGGAGNDVLAGQGGTYNQADYEGIRSDFSFIRNPDASVTVTSSAWGTDTLTDIDGVWFVGEAKQYDLDDLIDYDSFDTLDTGTSGDDDLTGTAGNDAILGGEGDDTLYGGAGDDLLDGQGGTYNQVDYDGAASDYTFIRNADDSITVSHATYGTDTLKNIDGVWFYGESAWYDLNALAPDPNTYVGTGNSGYFGGTTGDDTIIFTGGTGNYVSADAGNDIIAFSGNVADYNILGQGDHFTIENGTGSDAIQFTEVEYISFSDTGPVSLADIVANSTYSPGDTWFDPEPIGGLI